MTVAGAKGGTGKTTSSLALAAAFADRGMAVVLADCDPQASSTSALDQDVVDPSRSPLEEPVVRVSPGLPVVTSTIDLARGGRYMEYTSEAEVAAYLRRLAERADLVVVDCAPSLQPAVHAALAVCDLLLVPLEPEPLPVRGLAEMRHFGAAQTPGGRCRAVLTKYRAGLRLTRELETALDSIFPGLLFATRIPLDVRCADAPSFSLPVIWSAPRSRAAKAYQALADELSVELALTISQGSDAGAR